MKMCICVGIVGVNGVVNYNRSSSAGTMHADHHKRQRNYRLIVDPALKQGPTKVYSIEGHIPGVSEEHEHYRTVNCVVVAVKLL